jgi:peptidoglycan/LPS O-acetylase OafA/YrhL
MALKRALSLFARTNDETKDWIAPLDGLRAIAALLVLASHTGFLPVPFGTLGVLMFFTLSAFLLSRPFMTSNEIYSLRGTIGFFIRRIFRIIPTLIFYVFIYGMFIGGGILFFKGEEVQFIIDSLIWFKGRGHLWTINQELLFYAMMPIFAASVLALRRKPLFAAVVLMSFAWTADKYLTRQVFEIPGMDGYMQFFLSPFLVGMAAAYITPSTKTLIMKLHGNQIVTTLLSFAVLGYIIQLHWTSVRFYIDTGINAVGNWALSVSFGCGALLVFIASTPRNWLAVVLSFRPLRAIGTVGYSFYLWHWAAVGLTQQMAPTLRFAVTFVATFLVSLTTFFIIERPGMRLGAKLASMVSRPRGNTEARLVRIVDTFLLHIERLRLLGIKLNKFQSRERRPGALPSQRNVELATLRVEKTNLS